MNSESAHIVTGTSESKQVLMPAAIDRIIRHELHHVRSHWWWFLLLGSLLVLCGTLAIIFPLIGSVVAISVLSIILLVAGLATLVGAFWTGKWSGFLVHVLVGMLYLAAGFVVSERPLLSILLVTVYVAVTFMVMGVFRMMAAMMIRFPQWGWTLLNGCVTFLVGLVIYRNLPFNAAWVIGLLVGMEMLFNGWAWIMLSQEIRRIPAEPAA
jgi:uncharacterized membrane protein HdeD (DUF308 family)